MNHLVYKSIIGISLLIYTSSLNGQIWERTYSSYTNVLPYKIIESYDRGLVLEAGIAVGSLCKIGYLLKLDVNGEILWEKRVGNGTNIFNFQGIGSTDDGGLILSGTTDTLNELYPDPCVLKLNACGEVDWCRIFQTDAFSEFAVDLTIMDDNSFAILLINNQENIQGGMSAQLYHLSEEGELIWEQVYFSQDSLADGECPNSLELTPDQDLLVTGYCYYPVTGQTSPWWVWPMIILADSSGETVYELPWGYDNPFPDPCSGVGYQSSSINNNIYSGIANYHHDAPFVSPGVIKTSYAGTPVYFNDFKSNTVWGGATTIDNLSDTVLYFGMAYCYDSVGTLSVIKTDTNGTILKETVLKQSDYGPKDAIFTSDNKYLVTAPDLTNNKGTAKLWKLTPDLEFDSIYTQPRTYDSLCDHPIESGYLFFPCDVITSVREPASGTDKVRMTVYPNPAQETVTVRMPECVQIQSSTQHLNVVTTFHNWNKDLELVVTDLFGRIVLERKITSTEKEVSLSVDSWDQGLYFFSLRYKDKIVASEKVVISH